MRIFLLRYRKIISVLFVFTIARENEIIGSTVFSQHLIDRVAYNFFMVEIVGIVDPVRFAVGANGIFHLGNFRPVALFIE